jgi:hypothetical protein
LLRTPISAAWSPRLRDIYVSADVPIVPLHTAEEVLAEGAQMHNCVASHIPQVLGYHA